MAQPNRKNFVLGIIILIFGVLTIVGLLTFSYYDTLKNPPKFVANRKNIGEKLYQSVTNYDFENDYPQTPQALMERFNNTLLLLYGDMMLEDEYFKTVLEVQRQMFSEEILSLTSKEEQWKQLSDVLTRFKENGVRISSVELGSVYYDPFSEDVCTVSITESGVKILPVHMTYYLKKDTQGLWKINNWQTTDKAQEQK